MSNKVNNEQALFEIKNDIDAYFNIRAKNGKSFIKFYELFYHVRILKYASLEMLKRIRPDDDKIATEPNLIALEKLGYLKQVNEVNGRKIYIAKDKTIPAIEYYGIPKNLLPFESQGKGEANSLGISSVIADILAIDTAKSKRFNILYPTFPNDNPYIIPDALLVERRIDKYRLMFLEVENKKTDWEHYIQNKLANYNILAKDKNVYNYWKNISEKLKLPCPGMKDFRFSIAFIGNIKTPTRAGVSFIKNIKELL